MTVIGYTAIKHTELNIRKLFYSWNTIIIQIDIN